MAALIFLLWFANCIHGFQPTFRSEQITRATKRCVPHAPIHAHRTSFQPKGIPGLQDIAKKQSSENAPAAASATFLLALLATPSPANAAAGTFVSAIFAWFHFLGIFGVAGGLLTERLILKKNMTVDEENIFNAADLIYGVSALSLLVSGYFRVTQYAKGWDFYKNEPIFWLKMSSVAILGALSFLPAIIFFRRDMIRQEGETLPPVSDAIIDRVSTIINAELLALATIPLLASLMARGVLYYEDFPWVGGVVLYALSLGGAGYKYGKEAFDLIEREGALLTVEQKLEK